MPASRAASAAAVMPATQDGDRVPIFTVSAPASRANSPASSGAWTIAGEAPAASSAFAATFIAT